LTDTIIWKAREYRKSPTSTLGGVAEAWRWRSERPRREADSSTTSSCSSVAVWMNSTDRPPARTAAGRRSQGRSRAAAPERGPDALAAGIDDDVADLVDRARRRIARRSRSDCPPAHPAACGSQWLGVRSAVTGWRSRGGVRRLRCELHRKRFVVLASWPLITHLGTSTCLGSRAVLCSSVHRKRRASCRGCVRPVSVSWRPVQRPGVSS